MKPAPFLWIGIIVNTCFGIAYSPITKIRRVVVEGASPADDPAIEAAVKRWQGVPCLRVNRRAVEGEVIGIAGVRTALLSRNIFGSARLKMTYRVPELVLAENPSVGISREGVMFPLNAPREDLPTVTLTYFPRPSFSVFSTYEPATYARLASDARKMFPQATVGIVIDEAGTLCLNVNKVHCIFGTNQRLQEKLEAVKTQLSSEILLNAEDVTLNLMDPKSPVISGLRKEKE